MCKNLKIEEDEKFGTGRLLICTLEPYDTSVFPPKFRQCNYQAHIDIYKNGSLKACKNYA